MYQLKTNVAAPRPEVVVHISPQHLRILAGAVAVFSCTVSGLPGARVTWVRQMVSRGFFYILTVGLKHYFKGTLLYGCVTSKIELPIKRNR